VRDSPGVHSCLRFFAQSPRLKQVVDDKISHACPRQCKEERNGAYESESSQVPSTLQLTFQIGNTSASISGDRDDDEGTFATDRRGQGRSVSKGYKWWRPLSS
jgi:hypothetical protein